VFNQSARACRRKDPVARHRTAFKGCKTFGQDFASTGHAAAMAGAGSQKLKEMALAMEKQVR